ncbi:helical backbone metal receptor [Pseudomonas aeruginosa]|uniref:helical backbone metal receptor n=1 Tax=Pseudomonas aeruginosa TaxID=287 RepID=UPI00071B1823|nr:helical backbone metal receptor [Pseudomonas aeruginosa]KSS59666.1 cobalamin-binding protein [Pseudomonas aeruginosa]
MRSFWLLACLLLSLSAGAAQRVVSLAPSLTDSVLELGAARRLVGVLDGGERPAAIGDLPSVGRYGQVNLERLLELQPDLILVWPGSVPEAQLQRLRDFGIALFIAEPHSLDELALQLAALGEALGEAEAGQRLSARFREGMRRLAERYRREVISDALRVCGAENLFGDLPQPAPQVSVEAVLARDPAVIVAGSHAQLELWRQWPALAATRRGQLYRIEDKNLERPSFAMLAATEKLCRSLAGAR